MLFFVENYVRSINFCKINNFVVNFSTTTFRLAILTCFLAVFLPICGLCGNIRKTVSVFFAFAKTFLWAAILLVRKTVNLGPREDKSARTRTLRHLCEIGNLKFLSSLIIIVTVERAKQCVHQGDGEINDHYLSFSDYWFENRFFKNLY